MARSAVLALVVAIAIAAGCSNDVEMPSAYHRGYLAQPTRVEAAQDGDLVRVSWELTSTANVAGFVVSFTDESGYVETRFVDDPAAIQYEETELVLTADAVYLVQVWAVDAHDFFGPRSAVDSLVVR